MLRALGTEQERKRQRGGGSWQVAVAGGVGVEGNLARSPNCCNVANFYRTSTRNSTRAHSTFCAQWHSGMCGKNEAKAETQ